MLRTPDVFLILARLFWYQILICDSFRPSSLASTCRRSPVRYLLRSNSSFNRANCPLVKAVRGRLESMVSHGFGLRARGPRRRSSETRRFKSEPYRPMVGRSIACSRPMPVAFLTADSHWTTTMMNRLLSSVTRTREECCTSPDDGEDGCRSSA